MWLHQKPSYGECGSSGVSVCRWWNRWLDTHSVGSPCPHRKHKDMDNWHIITDPAQFIAVHRTRAT
jgi:hypothetical protein